MSPRLRWLLIASLALNLVLVTAVSTWAVVHRLHAGSGPMASSGMPSLRALQRHLGEDERQRLRAALEQHRGDFREQARQARRARADVERALLAEPFDRAALEDAMLRSREHGSGLAGHAHQAIADLADSMDREGRQRLVQAMRQASERAHHRERRVRREASQEAATHSDRRERSDG